MAVRGPTSPEPRYGVVGGSSNRLIALQHSPDQPGADHITNVSAKLVRSIRLIPNPPCSLGGCYRNRLRPIQWQPQPAQQVLPLIPSAPSFAMIGTITNPATGSAHHHPNNAFSNKPPKRMPDRYMQKSACLESACMAPLPIPTATRRFALARTGMTITAATAITTPGMLRRAVRGG